MFCYVRNIFNEPDLNGNVPLYIKISSIEAFNLYEFFQKLQLLKTENPYDIEATLSLDDIILSNVSQINTDITKLINQYSYLGTITHSIEIKDKVMYINVEMLLNKALTNGRKFIKQSIPIGVTNG